MQDLKPENAKIAEGYVPVHEPFFEVEDVWPPETLTQSCIMAYKLLEKRGELTIQKVIYNQITMVTKIRYLSMEPFESRRKEQLRQAKREAQLPQDAQ